MPRTSVKLVGLSLPLAVFGFWGMYTEAGRRRYDEMDGLYPLCAMLLAGVLVSLAGLLWIVAALRKSRD